MATEKVLLGRLHCLPPIIDERARVLILGSFPSEASLAARHYYAHKQNQFWRIMAALLALPVTEMEYPEKQRALQNAGIAVWDVFASCERQGSLDSAIRQGIPNDFAALKQRAPALARVCFNGQAAGKFNLHLSQLGLETLVLPSTSPANATWTFERKLAAWQAGLVGLIRQ